MANKEYNVSAVAKTMDILEFLMENKRASFTKIHTELAFPKSSTYQLLKTLEKYNMVTRAENGDFMLGIKLFEFGCSVKDNTPWRAVAYKHLVNLADKTQFTVHLSILSNDCRCICLEKIPGRIYTMQLTRVGGTLSIHSSASSKCLLAWSEPEVREKILKNIEYTPFTEKTIRCEADFLEELRLVRLQGYALDNRESEKNFRGVGAPLFGKSGRLLGSVSMGATVSEITEENVLDYARMVVEKCGEMREELSV